MYRRLSGAIGVSSLCRVYGRWTLRRPRSNGFRLKDMGSEMFSRYRVSLSCLSSGVRSTTTFANDQTRLDLYVRGKLGFLTLFISYWAFIDSVREIPNALVDTVCHCRGLLHRRCFSISSPLYTWFHYSSRYAINCKQETTCFYKFVIYRGMTGITIDFKVGISEELASSFQVISTRNRRVYENKLAPLRRGHAFTIKVGLS